jgi:hypothetical protein
LKIGEVLTPVVSNFNHFGGIQVADDILAAGYERFESGAAGTSVVLFYDVRSVASPTALDRLTIERTSSGQTAGAVGYVTMALAGCSWWRLGFRSARFLPE